MTLADILAPITVTEFLQSYLDRNCLVVPPQPAKFDHLLSWSELNDRLRTLRVAGNRLRLVHNGKQLDRAAYLSRPRHEAGSYIETTAFSRLLNDGATLVVDQVDELFPSVRLLNESLQELFKIYIGTNLYAGWRSDHGFDLHWDQHDTLILQVYGRKHWQVYEPTLLHPVEPSAAGEVPQPTSPPIWDGLLEAGSVLYMPRGWWHIARPIDEPSLHLTIGLGHLTGISLFEWLTNRLRASEALRSDVPHLRSADEQRAWLHAVRSALLEALDENVIDAFMKQAEAKITARPLISLPDDVVNAKKAPGAAASDAIRLASVHCFHFTERGDGSMAFEVKGTEWACMPDVATALTRLRNDRQIKLSELLEAVPSAARLPLRATLHALAVAGAVAISSQATEQVPVEA